MAVHAASMAGSPSSSSHEGGNGRAVDDDADCAAPISGLWLSPVSLFAEYRYILRSRIPTSKRQNERCLKVVRATLPGGWGRAFGALPQLDARVLARPWQRISTVSSACWVGIGASTLRPGRRRKSQRYRPNIRTSGQLETLLEDRAPHSM